MMTAWIISSTVLILGILILRRVLRGKISLRLQYALWLVVLVRLLCPLNFFESSLSIQNAVQSVQDRTQVQISTVEERCDLPADREPEGEQVSAEIPDENREQAALPEAAAPEENPEQTFVPEPAVPALNWEQIVLAIWLVGAVVMLSFTFGCNFQFARMLSRDRQEIQVPGAGVPVYVSSWVKTPCLVGIFRPVIYLTPEVAADSSTWNHVISHEMTHLEHLDHAFSTLRCVALCLHWYNPLVWLAARVSKEDAELACDEGTIARLGEQERIGYGETLIRLTCRSKNPADLMLASTTMIGTQGGIKARIRYLAKKPKTLAYAMAMSLVAIVLMIGCTFSGPVQAEELPDPAETTAPTETTLPEETEAPAQNAALEKFTVELPNGDHTNDNDLMLDLRNYLLDSWGKKHLGDNADRARYVVTGFLSPEGTEEATSQTSVYLYQVDFDVYLDDVEHHTVYAMFWKNDWGTMEHYYQYNGWEKISFFEADVLDWFDGQEYMDAYGNKYAAAVMAGAELFGEKKLDGKAQLVAFMDRLLESDGMTWCSELPEYAVPMQETNRQAVLQYAVGMFSWIAVETDPESLECDYCEFTLEDGDYLRVYHWGYGFAELCVDGEITRFQAAPLVRYDADEGRGSYYYAFKFFYGSYVSV